MAKNKNAAVTAATVVAENSATAAPRTQTASAPSAKSKRDFPRRLVVDNQTPRPYVVACVHNLLNPWEKIEVEAVNAEILAEIRSDAEFRTRVACRNHSSGDGQHVTRGILITEAE